MNDGIPLQPVRTNASSTGARQPHQTLNTGYDSSNDGNEKDADLTTSMPSGKRRGGGLNRHGTGDEVEVNAVGKLYQRLVASSPVVRNLFYIIPVGILIAIPMIVLGVLKKAELNPPEGTADTDGPTAFRILLWAEVWWVSLWVSKLAAWILPKIFMFLCGIVSAGVRKYATVLKNLKMPLSLFLWALISFTSFRGIFQRSLTIQNPIYWTTVVSNVLAALFAISGVFLAEKAIVQLIGVTYHQRSFANRIKGSKREVYLLGLLYEASRTLFPMYCTEFAEEDYVIDDSIEMALRKKAGHKRTGSATPMKILGNVGRIGDKVTSAFGNVASEITGKQVFNPHSAHSIVVEALEKRLPSEALARRIWLSFVCAGRDALFVDDFYEVLGEEYREEAEEAFGLIDADLNGDISLEEMILKVVAIGSERKAISEGMKDIGQALQAFDKVLMFVVFIAAIIIFILFFNDNLLKSFGTIGTALLSMSFVFAVTTQEFLGSCIFLFVKHPFDVGDRVEINKIEMTVERISLLYSVFIKTDTMQTTQIPNIQLNNLWIDNVTRSKNMSESFQTSVSYDTSFEDVELLRIEMEKFVRAPENSRDFNSDFTVGIGGVGNLDKLVLNFTICHKSNWHNSAVRSTRRSKFMCALALALKKVPIYAPGGGSEALGGPTNPTYSVAVSDAAAAKSREDAAKAKDSARMVPTPSTQTTKEHEEAETKAVSELTSLPLNIETLNNDWNLQETLPGEEEGSSDPQRAREIAQIRTDLHKNQSQRGRRKAGDGIAAHTAQPEQHFPMRMAGPTLETYDEEPQLSFPQPQPYSGASGDYAVDMSGASRQTFESERPRPSMSVRTGVQKGVSWVTRKPTHSSQERQ